MTIYKTLISQIQKLTDAHVMLGGSTAKGTALTNTDCDIFVRFPLEKYKNSNLSEEVEKILCQLPYAFEKIHGSRDYFQIEIDRIIFEIIPVLLISNPKDAQNVTDMSPLHVDWAISKFKEQDVREDIKKAKQFCKAQRVYGAESYVGGFSGHVLDILVIYYGGFEQLLSEAIHWNFGDVIDVENHYQDKDPFAILNQSKTQSPLIVIDPLQPDRNAASALTQKTFDIFREKAHEYLKNPSHSFFEKQPFTADLFEGNVYELLFEPLDGKKDIVAAKVKKVFEFIIQQLVEYDFTVSQSDWEFDYPSKAYISIKYVTLPLLKEIMGPPISLEKAGKDFAKKHPGSYSRSQRWWAKINREFVTVDDFFEYILKQNFVLDRVNSVRFRIVKSQ